MKLDISLVPYGLLTATLAGLTKQLDDAARLTAGRTSSDDIARAFYNGFFSLWVVFEKENGTLVGFFALEIKNYPQLRMLCIPHCVIEPGHMKTIEPRMQELATRFAKDNGCSGIEFVGRPGWRRYSKEHGYGSHSVTYQQFFEPEQVQ